MRSHRPAHPAAPTAGALTTPALRLTGATATVGTPPPPVLVVDDFEHPAGLPVGTDADDITFP